MAGSGVRTVSGLEAVSLGLMIGGCRLAFAGPSALGGRGRELGRFARRLARLGGALVQVESDRAAALFAAGASLAGARSVALVADGGAAVAALAGLEDLAPVLVDLSDSLPLHLSGVRVMLAPYSARTAFAAGYAAGRHAADMGGPGLIAGLAGLEGALPLSSERVLGDEPPLPFAHRGPDDPDLLLLSAGPGYGACDEARQRLEAAGVTCAHLHLWQLAPFPGAIIAPVVTSARAVLVVEPGERGTLAGHVRCHLGAPAAPLHQLFPTVGVRPGPDAIVRRAMEVVRR